ncbi:nuclear condensing complex subunit [Phellopilus nigrolimitatus]|nr:nuclear condensing complex subunit [Phellopilus nigrolimitatus]
MAPRATFDLDALATSIPTIFDQAQSSAATHRKNCVALYKLQSASAAVVETAEKGRKGEEVRLVGEKVFTEIFLNMLNRVIVVKKGTPNADRIVKFVANYIKFLNDKNVEDNDDDSSTTRFVARLLKHFLKGFQAKSKDVRFRCLNFVSDIVSSLGEIDQDLYSELRTSLLERLCDKESLVRAHCVAALSKLATSEDPNDLEDDEQPIVTSLLDRLFYDPAVEVRRAAFIHIPFTPATLPALLTRSRDVDAVTRKLVYATVLPRLAHPKQLTIAQREQIVQQGLGDREEAVRVAAAKLLGSWVDLCEGDLTAFLQLFDVRMTTEVALDALKSVFVTRAEVVQEVEFDDMFWSKLQTETALLARAFVEHCIDTDDQARLEATLPVVTALAFHLQTQCNSFLEILQDAEAMRLQGDGENDDEVETREEQLADAEFVMSELLHLALHLDYTDEIGRRKMFGVVRNMLAHPELPESLITSCIGVLSVMSPNERDLIRLVVEIISELRDRNPGPGADDEDMGAGDETMDGESTIVTAGPTGIPGRSRSRSRRDLHEMSPEEKAEADVTDLRCLCLCIAVLERVHGSFEENSTLEGVLADLIIPSVKRKELALREKGLLGLGLCCLIAKNMALSSFQLFLSQVKSAPESLRIKVLQVIFDIMMTYEKDLLGSVEEIGGRVIAFLMQVLEAEESKGVQALICLGLSKLMLFGLVTDERVLTSLILAYVSPVSAENQELRQCLAYFLPVYCYSSPANQSRMQAIFIAAFDLVTRVYDEMEDDQDMIAPLQFGQLLIDWTDPSKVVGLPNAPNDSSVVHVNLAIDILKALYDNDRARKSLTWPFSASNDDSFCLAEDRKTLCQLLAKLVLPPDAEQPVLYTLYILVANLIELCPFEDTATDKAFLRFKARLEKHFSAMLRDYDEQACFQEEAYEEVFEFIGITRPKQRRFEGQVTADASAVLPSDGEAEGAPSKVKRGRQSTKRKRLPKSQATKVPVPRLPRPNLSPKTT